MAGMSGPPRVPYVDLRAQNRATEDAILEGFRRVLRHGQYILGPEVSEFEERMARRLGAGRVLGVGNGTDALVLALRLWDIGPGDEVITVSHSFVATASAIALVGATPVFVDVDEHTLTMDPSLADAAVTDRTRAVLPVHLAGRPADLDALTALCDARGLALIEDCAQAIGATWRGRSVGTFGVGCFSLHPLKALSALGDGGFLTLPDAEVGARASLLRNLGLSSRDHVAAVAGNSRLDSLQAAALLVKLDRLDAMLARRREHAAAYDLELPAALRRPAGDDERARWAPSAYVVRHPARERLCEGLQSRGVDAKIHYPVAIHQQPPFAGFVRAPLPVTERAVSEILSLPSSSDLSVADRDRVIAAARDVMESIG